MTIHQTVSLTENCSFFQYLKFSWKRFKKGIQSIDYLKLMKKKIESFNFDGYPVALSEFFIHFVDNVEFNFDPYRDKREISLVICVPEKFEFRKDERDFCGFEVHVERLIWDYLDYDLEISCRFLTSDGKIHRDIDEIDCNPCEIDENESFSYCVQKYLDSL